MKNMLKRLASLLLALVLVVSLLPNLALTAHAAVTADVYGECEKRYDGCIQLLAFTYNGEDRMPFVKKVSLYDYTVNNGTVTIAFYVVFNDGYDSKRVTISFADEDCNKPVNLETEYRYGLY